VNIGENEIPVMNKIDGQHFKHTEVS